MTVGLGSIYTNEAAHIQAYSIQMFPLSDNQVELLPRCKRQARHTARVGVRPGRTHESSMTDQNKTWVAVHLRETFILPRDMVFIP